MAIVLFDNLTEKDKSDAVERLISQSTPSQDFYFMVVLAVLMATFAVLIDSITVLIGSMLIAPLLSPFLSLSLGITISDGKVIRRSFTTIGKSFVASVIAGALVAILFGRGERVDGELVANLVPSFLYMGVAIVAGFAASFAMIKPRLNETLPGVVIAVAILPPLALVGVGLSQWNFALVSDSILLFFLNAVGIVFASMVTFSLMDFYRKKKVAKKTIKEEEKLLKEEEKKAEEIEKGEGEPEKK